MATDETTTAPAAPPPAETRPNPHGLTPAERRFVDAYYGGAKYNATRAAEMAGYKPDSRQALRVTAHRLLHRPRVRKAMQDERRKMMAELDRRYSGRR